MRSLPIVAIALFLASCVAGSPTDSVDRSPEELISFGSAAYQTFCAACHGTDLRGTTQGSSLLSIVYEPNHHADFAFTTAIKDGVKAHHWKFNDMPPTASITDDEIAAVIAFVRNVQDLEGFDQ